MNRKKIGKNGSTHTYFACADKNHGKIRRSVKSNNSGPHLPLRSNRCEPDTTFYQVEGMLVDKRYFSLPLKGVMKEFFNPPLWKRSECKIPPGYFPFVEPGIELDFSCLLCDQKDAVSAKIPDG